MFGKRKKEKAYPFNLTGVRKTDFNVTQVREKNSDLSDSDSSDIGRLRKFLSLSWYFDNLYGEEMFFLTITLTLLAFSITGYFRYDFLQISFCVGLISAGILFLRHIRSFLRRILILRRPYLTVPVFSVFLVIMDFQRQLGYDRGTYYIPFIFIVATFSLYLVSAGLSFVVSWLDLRDAVLLGKEPPYIFREKDRRIYEILSDREKVIQEEIDKRMKAENLRAELITNISHDLRTPLTSIINFSQLLTRDEDISAGRDYALVISKNAQRMKTLVEDLFTAAKSASGNVPLTIETLDFSEVLMQVYAPLHDAFLKKNMELIYGKTDTGVMIKGDGNAVSRITQNLLSNALKYSQDGTRVYIRVRETEKLNVFTFQSISKEKLDITPDELMEQFVRGDRSRSTEGSGLGLYIARNLARSMGGDLSLSISGDVFTASLNLPKEK